MPTYRNDSSDNIYSIKNNHGATIDVPPGESIQTFAFLSAPFTETSPLPVYNPVVFRNTLNLSAGEVSISFDPTITKTILITDISDIITEVFNEDVSVTPPILAVITASSPYLPKYDNSDGLVRKLVFKGTGTCVVTGYRT